MAKKVKKVETKAAQPKKAKVGAKARQSVKAPAAVAKKPKSAGKKEAKIQSNKTKPTKDKPQLTSPIKASSKKVVKAVPKAQLKGGAKEGVKEPKALEIQKSSESSEKSPKLGILQKRKSSAGSGAKVKKTKSGTKKSDSTKEGDSDISLNGQSAKWLQFYKKYGNLEALEYDMTQQFEEKKPIQHPKLGWGFVISIVNDRLEVLFQEGIKTLISNYNPDLKL